MNGPRTKERLYRLLPAVYRTRDALRGQPLRALLAIVDEQAAAIEDDILRLYESWFIETCPEWVVPYIGDLLGVRGLNAVSPRTYSQRAYVANVLAYRRRKGTAAMIEQLARDLTGWPARVVEYFELLATTQYMNHLRPGNAGALDLRDDARLGLLGGPFDDVPRTVDVRRIATGRGRHNIPNVGVHVFRLETDVVGLSPASPAADAPSMDGLYRVSPLGQDTPLWNRDRGEGEITELSDESTVPVPLRRRALHAALRDYRSALDAGAKLPRVPALYFGEQPVLRILVGTQELRPEEIVICNLEEWHRPPDTLLRPGGVWTIRAAVDPKLGRIALSGTDAPDAPPLIAYYESYVGRIGGGGYDRTDVAPTPAERLQGELAAASPERFPAPIAGDAPPTTTVTGGGGELASAITGTGVIVIGDSLEYELSPIVVPAGGRLELRAANRARPIVRLTAPLDVTLGAGSRLVIDGLLVTGDRIAVHASAGDASLALLHTTLVPGHALAPGNGLPLRDSDPCLACPDAGLHLQIARSIVGRLEVPAAQVLVRDSIVDGAGGASPALDAGVLTAAACTVLGETRAVAFELLTDCIFTSPAVARRNQQGCVRFSYVPEGSITPSQYRCQPALALEGASLAEHDARVTRLRPSFTSTRYGQPGYGQLAAGCDSGITEGASDESEMGAFQFLQQPQRQANLRASLDEYLRFGLEAGVFFVT